MDDENFIIEKVTTLLETPENMTTQYLPTFYWDTVEKINRGIRVCVIMRGLPGSGKSFIAKKIIEDTIKTNTSEHIISTDGYFMRNGRYQYDVSKLSEAHQATQRLFINRASKGYSPLIVDNTNMEYWEFLPYVQAALQYDYHIEILEPQTPWKFTPSKLSQKNKHSVPMDKIKRMLDKYHKIGSVKEYVRTFLNQDLVKEPKMRNIPPYSKPKNTATSHSDLINLDDNANETTKNGDRGLLTWEKLTDSEQLDLACSTNYFSWNVPKKNQTEFATPASWAVQAQIFEDKWEDSTVKEVPVAKEKTESEPKPQPQRKLRKSKKPSSSPEVDELKPHRRHCPNENPNFAELRDFIYPNIHDKFLWDFFEKCKGNVEWCADMLCDENFTDLMDTGEVLTCTCNSDSSDSSASIKFTSTSNGANNFNKKQTPVKAKKVKSNDELLAAKFAIEESVKIGNEFYPDHVNRVKEWKGITPQVPQSELLTEEELLATIKEINDMEKPKEEETLVALSIDKSLISKLNELFGSEKETIKSFLDDTNSNFKSTVFIKSSTAKQLYKEIVETFHSYQEEARFKEIENDRYFAMMLHEQEKACKYPKLVQNSKTNNFKDIMDTQEQLKEYQEAVAEWETPKPDSLSIKLTKEKLYTAFSSVDKDMIDQIFHAQDNNFSKTIELIQDNLGYNVEQRREVNEKLQNSILFAPVQTTNDDEEEFTPEEFACIKRLEDLQEQFDHHSEEQMRCIQKSREHIAKKEFRQASYYTSIVSLHKQLCDEKRQEIMNIFAYSFLNNAASTRLDLHYFTQEGGRTRLHTFLDQHIAKLREIKKQFVDLEIVTGRGAHSTRGPILKNMTIKLFQERGLRYTELNPGLLKVKVYQNSMLYEEKQRSLKAQEN